MTLLSVLVSCSKEEASDNVVFNVGVLRYRVGRRTMWLLARGPQGTGSPGDLVVVGGRGVCYGMGEWQCGS